MLYMLKTYSYYVNRKEISEILRNKGYEIVSLNEILIEIGYKTLEERRMALRGSHSNYKSIVPRVLYSIHFAFLNNEEKFICIDSLMNHLLRKKAMEEKDSASMGWKYRQDVGVNTLHFIDGVGKYIDYNVLGRIISTSVNKTLGKEIVTEF